MDEEHKKKKEEEKKEITTTEEKLETPVTTETKEAEMEHGERDEDVYTKEGREKLEEDGEISPAEEGFMEGASDDGQLSKDALTGEPLMDIEDVVETEIDGQTYRFVNAENARKFREKKEE